MVVCKTVSSWLSKVASMVWRSSMTFICLFPNNTAITILKTVSIWFSAQDTTGEKGELQSILNMIAHVSKSLEESNVFIVGLSAGGAMATSLLSQYPNQFKAGAIIAGLPFSMC